MEFYPGIEFSCKTDTFKCHILGFAYDENHPMLREALVEAEVKREDKLSTRIKHLKEVDRIELSRSEIDELRAIHSAGKPHIANILMHRGIAGTRNEIIAKYLEFDTDTRIPAEHAISAIQASGSFAIWAHPLGGENEEHFEKETFLKELNELISIGIQGLECYYSRYNQEEIALLLNSANNKNLLVSGGSDFHVRNKNGAIGELNKDRKPVFDSSLSLATELRRKNRKSKNK